MRRIFCSICYSTFILLAAARSFDDIEREMQSNQSFKILRAMTNQTKDDNPLNLPANSSSIRQNISDTFSCENRTYGYYADVDNDCQVFHVCLPSQTPSGRNITYKWSFICPNETIFNQEVLVCTRPIDSVPCEEAPMYYDVNMEFGKTNNTKEETTQKPQTESVNSIDTNKNMTRNKNNGQRRKPDRKNGNLVVENAQFEKLQSLENKNPLNILASIFKPTTYDETMKPSIEEIEITDETMKEDMKMPDLIDAVIENEPSSLEDSIEIPMDEVLESARLVAERSMRWKDKKRGRNSMRFRADV